MVLKTDRSRGWTLKSAHGSSHHGAVSRLNIRPCGRAPAKPWPNWLKLAQMCGFGNRRRRLANWRVPHSSADSGAVRRNIHLIVSAKNEISEARGATRALDPMH